MAVDNEPVTAALIMDRSSPIGNSPDQYARRSLHVLVTNGDGQPIPIQITTAVEEGEFFDFEGETTPGAEQILISETVPVGELWRLAQTHVSTVNDGVMRVRVDGDLVASARTAPGNPNAPFSWSIKRPILAGGAIELAFEAYGDQPLADLEAYLVVSKETA